MLSRITLVASILVLACSTPVYAEDESGRYEYEIGEGYVELYKGEFSYFEIQPYERTSGCGAQPDRWNELLLELGKDKNGWAHVSYTYCSAADDALGALVCVRVNGLEFLRPKFCGYFTIH